MSDNPLLQLWNKIRTAFEELDVLRTIKDVDAWDGAASNYSTTDAYCKACLIDVNSAAGKDEKAQSHCMLPVREEGDSTGAYVRQAVHAAAGGRGISRVKRPDDVPEDAWNSAVKAAANKIIAAYKEMDEVAPDAVYEAAGRKAPERAISTSRLWHAVYSAICTAYPSSYMVDLYHDGPEMFALYETNALLYRVPVGVVGETITLGDPVQVTESFPAVEPTQLARTRVFRQQDGKWRWFSVSASAVVNKDGEIDSRLLFDNLIRRAEENGDYPYRTFYHQGEQFRTGQTDWLARDGYLLLSSGLYDDNELAAQEVKARQSNPDLWGDSIHYLMSGEPELLALDSDITIPVYNDGTLVEISTVRVQDASGWFVTSRVKEVKRMLDEKTFDAFVQLWGGDQESAQSWLDSNVDEVNRVIEANNMVARSAATDAGTNANVDSTEPEGDPEPQVIELDEGARDAIVQALVGSSELAQLFQSLNERVDSLTASVQRQNETIGNYQARIEALERDEDEKRQEWVQDLPAQRNFRVTYRPRQIHGPRDGGANSSLVVPMSDLAERAGAIEWPS